MADSQQAIPKLVDDDLTPLVTLEDLLQPCFIPLPGVPFSLNEELQTVSRRNL